MRSTSSASQVLGTQRSIVRHPLEEFELAIRGDYPEPHPAKLAWLAILTAGAVWFAGTVMIIKFLVAG
jgi:hypothetical protein